jgi:hypothetical protein
MRVRLLRFAVLAAPLALAACSGDQGLARTFGLSRDAPDEFRVTTQAPLSMPPDFALRPPDPGAPRPQEQSDTRQAEEALVPNVALGQGQGSMSAGQEALIAAAGPPAPRNIGARVDSETARLDNNNGFVDQLMFWRQPAQPGIVVDPEREAQRLRQNAALGQSPQLGDTPIVQPKGEGGPLAWLGNLF